MEQFPHDFLFAVHLEHAHLAGVSLGVTADDSVAVGQALTSARIGKATVDVRVVYAPDDLTLGIKLHRLVAVRQVDDRVAVGQTDRGERPILGSAATKFGEVGLDFVHHRAVRPVFLHLERQQMRHEIIAVGQFTSHPRLHMAVVGLRLERHLDGDFTVLGDLEQAWLWPPLDDQRVAVGQAPRGAQFLVRLGQRVAPHDLHVTRHLLGHVVRGKENVAIRQNGAVARMFVHLPDDLAFFVDELSQPAADQNAVAYALAAHLPDGRLVRGKRRSAHRKQRHAENGITK